ncbi:MAG TPA: arylsulfotransferase family protein [Xanthomonadaceae bacterium]|jgi:hypothetical protein
MKVGIAIASAILVASAASAAPQIAHYGVTINAGASVYPGNVLFTDCSDTNNPDAWARAYLESQDGHVVHTWKNGDIRNLMKPVGTDGTIVAFRGGGHPPTACSHLTSPVGLSLVGPNNELTPIYFDADCRLNHDFEVLKDGTYLINCQLLVTNTSVSTQPFFDNILRKIDANGNVLWSWSTGDHYGQFTSLSDDARAIIMRGQKLYLPENPATPRSADVFHTNDVQIIPPNASAALNSAFTPGNILVSQRNTNLIFVIDQNSGNVVWQTDNISVGQHHVRMIPTGLPGDGHLLMFDNGGVGGYPPINRPYSRVLEYDPVARSIAWQWTSPSPALWGFSAGRRGSAQRLPNGNTFVDEATWGRFFELDPNGNIVWEFVHLFGAPKVNPEAPDRTIYRAYKVEACWPGCPAQAGVPSGSLTTFTW